MILLISTSRARTYLTTEIVLMGFNLGSDFPPQNLAIYTGLLYNCCQHWLTHISTNVLTALTLDFEVDSLVSKVRWSNPSVKKGFILIVIKPKSDFVVDSINKKG
jgi:hypothetical protein